MYSSVSCSKCQLDHLVADPQSGEVICSMCGLVIQEKMQATGVDLRGPEPSSLAYYDMGLSTIMDKTDKDGKGQSIDPFVHSTIQRLRTWDHRIQLGSSKARNLKRAFYMLNNLKDKLNLSDVAIEEIAHVYRKALTKDVIRNRSINAILVGAIYIVLGQGLSPTSLKEVAKVSNVRPRTIARMARLLSSALDIMIPITDPIVRVTKVANIAEISEKTKREAVNLMSYIKDTGYCSGKNPMTLLVIKHDFKSRIL
jgi:transcription initiation factor TFIIB